MTAPSPSPHVTADPRRDPLATGDLVAPAAGASPFRLVEGDGRWTLHGDVDAHEVDRLAEWVGAVPPVGELVVDISDTRYLHHTVFPALERAPREIRAIRVVGTRRALQRVWEAVGDHHGRLTVEG